MSLPNRRRTETPLVPAWVLWSSLLALGLLLFFRGYLPALAETERTQKLVLKLEEETRELRRERDRLALKTQALETDPAEIERSLRRHGRGPADFVPVIQDRR